MSIGERQARALSAIDPGDICADTKTMKVKRNTDTAIKILQMQADAEWGEDRVNSALTRLNRRRIYG